MTDIVSSIAVQILEMRYAALELGCNTNDKELKCFLKVRDNSNSLPVEAELFLTSVNTESR